jgi:hypothetical protein
MTILTSSRYCPGSLMVLDGCREARALGQLLGREQGAFAETSLTFSTLGHVDR